MPKRILLDLSDIFTDFRKKSFVFRNETWERVEELVEHIRTILNIEERIFVTSLEDVYYPAQENIKVLKDDNELKIKILQSAIENSAAKPLVKTKSSKVSLPPSNAIEDVTPTKRIRSPSEPQPTSASKKPRTTPPTVTLSQESSSDSSSSASETSEDQPQVKNSNASTVLAGPSTSHQEHNGISEQPHRRRRKRTRGKRKQKPVIFNPETDLDENGYLIESRLETPHPEPRVHRLTKFWEKKTIIKPSAQEREVGECDTENSVIAEDVVEEEEEEMDLTPRKVTGAVKRWCPKRLVYVEVTVLPTIAEGDNGTDHPDQNGSKESGNTNGFQEELKTFVANIYENV